MSDSPWRIRRAQSSDAHELREIYRPYVEGSSVSFELEVPSVEEMASRVEDANKGWCWLVAVDHDQLVGYAYGSLHRARPAYARSVETSAYVAGSHHRRGLARTLYQELFRRLAELGFANAYAGITLPNHPSVGFHQSFGFQTIGVFPRVGYKLGQWHDVLWLYRPVTLR